MKSLLTNLVCILFIIGVLDIFNIDDALYCFTTLNFLLKPCVYYDLPFWEVLTAVGTISSGLFAYAALNQSNTQLKAEQTPIIVGQTISKEQQGINGPYYLEFKNIGKGTALKLSVTTDYDGRVSALVEESQNYLYYKGDGFTQGFPITSESVIEKSNEIILYLHYFDINYNRYKTVSKFKVVKDKEGNFVNNLSKDNEVYQVTPSVVRLL